MFSDPAAVGPDGLPCTPDGVPSIVIPPQCAPFTTTAASTVVLNSGNVPGSLVPPGGTVTVTGVPFMCAGGVPTTASGSKLTTAASFLDSTIGDLAATVELICL